MPKPPSTRGPRPPGRRPDPRKAGAAPRPGGPVRPRREGDTPRPDDARGTRSAREHKPARSRPEARSRSEERPARTGERPPRRNAEPRSAKPDREERPPRGRLSPAPAPASAKPQRERRAAAFRSATGAPEPKPRAPGPAPRRAKPAAAPAEADAPRPFVDGEPQRIAKLLARAGIASRREIERMIADRRIAVEGVPIETPATILASLRGVSVDGKPVRAAAETRLFLFHKPPGLLTAERDFSGRPTIYDRLPPDLPRLMPVGRLDLNTEGLLLLTNDGEFKRQLELPSTGVERTYRARVFGDVSQEQLEDLIHGIEIEGIRYGPIDANLERRTGRNGWVEMRLTEGKNREVRRVLEFLGLQVSRLLRVAYGPFVLGDLPVGGVGEVRHHDLAEFRKTLK